MLEFLETIPLWQRIILGCTIGILVWSVYRLLRGQDARRFMQLAQDSNDEYARDPVSYHMRIMQKSNAKKHRN